MLAPLAKNRTTLPRFRASAALLNTLLHCLLKLGAWPMFLTMVGLKILNTILTNFL